MKLNGNLVLNSDATGEIQNVYIHKLSETPAFNASEKGRLIFNTGDALYYYNNGIAWISFATGGNATALQTEVDAIEAALGGVVGANGVYNATAFSVNPIISGSGSVTGAILALADYANGKDALSELLDVSLSTPTTGQYLQYNGTKWVNDTLTLSDVTGVTALATDVNLLTGLAAAGVTGTELGYVTDVTSNIQGQLDLKQPLDAGLTALAALNAPGIVVQTAADTYTGRTLVAPSAGIRISSANGVAGNPTFALSDDLADLEGLSTSGYAVRDEATGTWNTRSLSVTSGDLVITGSADGVATDTTFGLATVTQVASGNFVKVTLDTKGRVTGNTPVTIGDITGLVDGEYVNVAGDTMTGNLNMGGTHTVTGLAAPVNSTDAANKAYVDAQTQGLSWKQAVVAASTANVVVTAPGATIDGVTLVAGDRVLLKNQTTASQNGIYVFDTAATALVRAADMDVAAEFDGSAVFVQQGSINEGTGWTETLTVATVGSSNVAFSQFSGGQAFVWGTGLGNTGNTIFVNLGAGISELPTDEIGIDVAADKAIQLSSIANNGQLTFVLDGAGLEQSAAGLKISTAGVTNAMLANPQFTINGDSGTDALVLGDTLQIKGTAAQGISTVVAETGSGPFTSTFTVTAANASATQKGVATFNANNFTVTSGNVVIADAGVTNAQLANSTIGYAGTTGGVQTVALGSSFSILGGTTPITTVSAAGSVTINVADATAGAKGLASFAAADFLVTAGAVTAVAKPLDSLTDVTIGTASAGQTLVYSAGTSQFVNRPTYYLYTAGGASTSHVVPHNLGQQYCNVTVVDSTDEVVIPQSIKFDSATQLTVTFTSALLCKVIVMGVNAA